jgi:putative DNA primase/helicase
MTDVTNLMEKRAKLNALGGKTREAAELSEITGDAFTVNEHGVFAKRWHDQSKSFVDDFVCSPLRVIARSRTFDGSDWGYVLEFDDPQKQTKRWILPSRMLAGDGNEFRAALLSQGVQLSPKPSTRPRLHEFIVTRFPDHFARTTDRIGWHDSNVFVLPEKSIGERDELVLYQSEGALSNTFRQKGTIDAWRETVAKRCAGNSRLLFAVSCAFAGSLLKLAGVDSGGFHLCGGSSSGKTTALRVAASIWGGDDFMQRWRTTENALESTAAQHCDTVLILDEIAQLEPSKAGECAYMLANESGKARSRQSGMPRTRLAWRVLFLSAGEIGLADHVAESGKRVHTGQEVRMVDLPADAGGGRGAFDVLHDFEAQGASSFADALAAATRANYGVAGIAFLEHVAASADSLATRAKNAVETLSREWVGESSSGQVARVARRFALVAYAGELATEIGLTGWQAGEATISAKVLFDAWIDGRGGVGNGEEARMIGQVRAFLELHGAARFTWWHRAGDDHAPNTMNRAGLRRMIAADGTPAQEPQGEFSKSQFSEGQCEYYVLPQVFRTEVCKGYDYRAVCRFLIDRGYMKADNNRLDTLARLPTLGRSRCYRILPSIFEIDAA